MAKQQGPFPKGFYIVTWGASLRVTTSKVSHPLEAARKCYGMVLGGMRIKFLSSRKANTNRIDAQIAAADRNGWYAPVMNGVIAREVVPYTMPAPALEFDEDPPVDEIEE